MQIDLTKYDFEDIEEYVASMIGSEFMKCVALAQDIAENPSKYVGAKAMLEAKKLAAWRVQIGVVESFYKRKSPATKAPSDLLIKDAIITLQDTTMELLNVLKIVARES